MASSHLAGIKMARKRYSFGKRTHRASVAERGNSMCAYCGVEHGSEKEHIWPVAYAVNYPLETAAYIVEAMGVPMDVTAFMKSGNNHAPACTRCNFEKRQIEDGAQSPEARKALMFQWLNKAKRWNGERWITRSQKVVTAKKRQHNAQEIAALKGKNVKRRAAIRRTARGRKNWAA